MGILDELAKNLDMGPQRAQPGGGGQGAVIQAVMGMLAGGGPQQLIASFQQKGLGDVVGSWVSTGANRPVSPEQVGQALGPDQLGRAAREILCPAPNSTRPTPLENGEAVARCERRPHLVAEGRFTPAG